MKLINADALVALNGMDDNTIDSLVTDPPAGISFMNKDWDKPTDFIKNMTSIYIECLRVLKPGAHGLVWAIPRTSHWTATALEQAGFEIRDKILHLFGQGFPKSKNCGEGRGTGLKPAVEEWILVRKPLGEKTVAKNLMKWGCGALNIDQSRIGYQSEHDRQSAIPYGEMSGTQIYSGNSLLCSKTVRDKSDRTHNQGRFPSNLVLSHNEDCEDACTEDCAVKALDEQSVGSSRFFYCAKASRRDRNAGLDGMPEKYNDFQRESSGLSQGKDPITGERSGTRLQPQANHHPTVKSTKLMEYLIRLITPPQGTVLDPFMGSGSTGVAAKRLGFKFVGSEMNEEYYKIAVMRVTNGR